MYTRAGFVKNHSILKKVLFKIGKIPENQNKSSGIIHINQSLLIHYRLHHYWCKKIGHFAAVAKEMTQAAVLF